MLDNRGVQGPSEVEHPIIFVWDPETATMRAGDGTVLDSQIRGQGDLALCLRAYLPLDPATADDAARETKIPRSWRLDDGRRLLALGSALPETLHAARPSTRVFVVLADASAPETARADVPAALAQLGAQLGLGPNLLFWRVDAEGRFTRAERDERGAILPLETLLLGRTLKEAFAPSEAIDAASIDRVEQVLRRGEAFKDLVLRLPALTERDGPTEWRFCGYPTLDADGRLSGMTGAAIDDGFARFLEVVPVPATLWEWAERPRVLAANRAMRAMTGLTIRELQGATAPELLARTGAEMDNVDFRLGFGRMDGERFWIRNAETDRYEYRMSAIQRFERPNGECALSFFVDVTKSLDREQIGRARAFARLAASIAHDVGNTVTVLNGMVGSLVDSDRETREELTEDIQETVDRMSVLLQRLKRLSLGTSEYETDATHALECDPDQEVERSVKLFRIRYPDLALEFAPSASTRGDRAAAPRVRISALDLERAITNLLVNAVDASGVGGRILLTTALQHGAQGSIWQLQVEDDGPGFPDLSADFLMQPHVSSKGSGLGLFQISGLVRSLGGDIRLGRSEHLGGASVRLYLPAA